MSLPIIPMYPAPGDVWDGTQADSFTYLLSDAAGDPPDTATVSMNPLIETNHPRADHPLLELFRLRYDTGVSNTDNITRNATVEYATSDFPHGTPVDVSLAPSSDFDTLETYKVQIDINNDGTIDEEMDGFLVTGYIGGFTNLASDLASLNPPDGAGTYTARARIHWDPYYENPSIDDEWVNLEGDEFEYVTGNHSPVPASPAEEYFVPLGAILDMTTNSSTAKFGLLADVTDPDGDSFTVTLLGASPQFGQINVNSQTGGFVFEANSTNIGTDVIQYRITDDLGAFADASIIIHVVEEDDEAPEDDDDCGCGAGGDAPIDPETNPWIREIAGTNVWPTRYNDIPLKLRIAMGDGSNITYHSTLNSGEGWYVMTGGQYPNSTGPRMIDNNEMEWKLRLWEIKQKYVNDIAADVTGWNAFMDRLIEAAGRVNNINITPQEGGDGAKYVPELDSITVYKPSIANVPDNTIIHETVHALDDQSGWYLNAPPFTYLPNLRKIEALGYNSEGLLDLIDSFHGLDEVIRQGQAANVSIKWLAITSAMRSYYKSNDVTAAGVAQPTTPTQLKEALAKFQLDFGIHKLACKYNQALANKGINIVLPEVHRPGGAEPNSYALPPPFGSP